MTEPEPEPEPPAQPADVEAPDEPSVDDTRYGHFSLEAGDLVIYDRGNPDSWLQSDTTAEIHT